MTCYYESFFSLICSCGSSRRGRRSPAAVTRVGRNSSWQNQCQRRIPTSSALPFSMRPRYWRRCALGTNTGCRTPCAAACSSRSIRINGFPYTVCRRAEPIWRAAQRTRTPIFLPHAPCGASGAANRRRSSSLANPERARPRWRKSASSFSAFTPKAAISSNESSRAATSWSISATRRRCATTTRRALANS